MYTCEIKGQPTFRQTAIVNNNFVYVCVYYTRGQKQPTDKLTTQLELHAECLALRATYGWLKILYPGNSFPTHSEKAQKLCYSSSRGLTWSSFFLGCRSAIYRLCLYLYRLCSESSKAVKVLCMCTLTEVGGLLVWILMCHVFQNCFSVAWLILSFSCYSNIPHSCMCLLLYTVGNVG